MNEQELTKEQYLGTMDALMRFIEIDDNSYEPVPIGDYVEELIEKLDLPTTRKSIQIHAIYMNDKKGYCHILFNWGISNIFLVVITKPHSQNIVGFRLLNLNKEYGLDENG